MFSALWDDHFPSQYKKLEIQLQVYFAIYPLLFPDAGLELKETMGTFKQFLERRGQELTTNEHMQFYALPYVPDPRTHPAFKDLFISGWASGLLEQLEMSLSKILPNDEPKLIDMLCGPIENGQKEVRDVRLLAEVENLKALNEQQNEKLKNVQAGYHQVITVAADLVQTLANSISGQKISPQYLADIVKRLSSLRKYPKRDIKPQLIPPVKKQLPIELFDYEKIKQDLAKTTIDKEALKKQAYLVQALRILLTTTKDRKADLDALIKNDLLDLYTTRKSISAHLLASQSDNVREQIARLLNVIATDCSGREYLLHNSAHLVGDMVHALKLDKNDTPFRQNILGALQKLSLRRTAQSAMNDLNMVSWLVDMLQELDTISEYSIEYGAALLMNLCLRTKGKKEAIQNPSKMLKTLNELIEHDNVQVKTYVNGCLYSLFSDSKMREQAQQMGMEEQLKYMKGFSDAQLSKQIDFVIEKLGEQDEEQDCEDESIDGEEADTTDEDDEQEFMTMEDNDIVPGGLSGRELLESEYCRIRDARKWPMMPEEPLKSTIVSVQ